MPEPLTERRVTGVVLGGVVLAVLSGVLLLVAAEGDLRTGWEPERLLLSPHPEILRWALVCDLFWYYLPALPLALALRVDLRERDPFLADLGAVCAAAYVWIGASGAVVLARAGPPLLESGSAETFEVVARIV